MKIRLLPIVGVVCMIICAVVSYKIIRGDFFTMYTWFPYRELVMWLVPVAFAVIALLAVVLEESLLLKRHERARPAHIPYDRQASTEGGEHLR